MKPKLDIEAAFFREKTHILRPGNADWPPRKILLQLAIEHAARVAPNKSAPTLDLRHAP